MKGLKILCSMITAFIGLIAIVVCIVHGITFPEEVKLSPHFWGSALGVALLVAALGSTEE